MTKANRERQEKLWNECVERIKRIGSTDLKHALELITSPNERKLISLRSATLKMIDEGKSYNDIRRELGAGPQIVSALRKAIKAKHYISSWEKTKVDIEIKRRKAWKKRQGRNQDWTSRKLRKFHSHLL